MGAEKINHDNRCSHFVMRMFDNININNDDDDDTPTLRCYHRWNEIFKKSILVLVLFVVLLLTIGWSTPNTPLLLLVIEPHTSSHGSLSAKEATTTAMDVEEVVDQQPCFLRHHQSPNFGRQLALSSLFFGGGKDDTTDYKDPKSIQLKQPPPPPQFELYHLPPPTIQTKKEEEEEEEEEEEDYQDRNKNENIHILAIGGTVTMGGRLEKPTEESYPYLLGASKVHVISHPYESIEYLSLCLDTILSEEEQEGTTNQHHLDYHHTHYDVILLEFSMIESYITLAIETHLPLLLQRLRQRYPYALIVYVHLWPMVALVEEESTGIRPGTLVPSDEDLTLLKWQWIQDSPLYRLPPKLESIIQDVHKGYIYYLPFHSSTPQESDWFFKDWWHLSNIGHVGVAQGIQDLLISQKVKLKKKRYPPPTTQQQQLYYKGDQCNSWFTNGIIPLEYMGGQIENIYETNPILPKEKYILEAVDSITTLTVYNPFTSSVPIYISYLTAVEPLQLSLVQVHVQSSSSLTTTNKGNNNKDSRKVLIDPNVAIAQNLPSIQVIDTANPGINTIYIETIESKQNPFRLVGIFLSCGSNSFACTTTITATTPEQPATIAQQNQQQKDTVSSTSSSPFEKKIDTTKVPSSSSQLVTTTSTTATATATASNHSPIRILALGGSNTWGAFIPDRYRAYPWLIEESFNGALSSKEYVDNVAMRATGADYPSLCLESMIPDSATKNYDVILFDFVLNGTNGFFLLLKRLRERYPDAILIYVHIWNILSIARYKGKPPSNAEVGLNPDLDWEWGNGGDTFNPNGIPNKKCPREICDGAVMEQLTVEAGGYIYKLPLPPTPKEALANGWFGPDWQHLSINGHEMLANGILDILHRHEDDVRRGPKRLGTFGLGDQCYQWFAHGNVQPKFTGAKLVNLIARDTQRDPNVAKWVMEIDTDQGGTINFESKFSIRVPIGLSYMSKQQDSSYTIVEVSINSGSKDGEAPRRTAMTIDPNYNLSGPTTHITVYSHVGWANPGINTVTIRTVEKRQLPFRVVGIFLCGHCAERGGDMGNGALRSIDEGSSKEQQ